MYELSSIPEGAAERLGKATSQMRAPSKRAGIPKMDPHAAHDQGSVRRSEYRGLEIEITSRYEIRIDGELWDQHVQVLNDGTVHYHGMPQYQPLSLVELVERVVDIGYLAPQEVLDAAAGDL